MVKEKSKVLNSVLIAVIVVLGILFFLFVLTHVGYFPGGNFETPIPGSFTCSANQDIATCSHLTYNKTGQLSFVFSQHIFTNSTIYHVQFACIALGVNYTNANYGGLINGEKNGTIPYNVSVNISDIQCYNQNGPVALGPKSTFNGGLFIRYSFIKNVSLAYIKNIGLAYGQAALIEPKMR